MSANSLIRQDKVLVGSGTFACTLKLRTEAGFPDINQSATAELGFGTPWGGTVSFLGPFKYTDGVSKLGWSVSATSHMSGTTDTDTVGYTYPHADDIPITGTFEIWVDADIVHVRDDDVSTDANGFPDYGGPSIVEFPWPCHTRTYRTTQPGGTYYATISATDGTYTATATSTGTIASRTDLGPILMGYPYDVGPGAIWAYGNLAVTEFTSYLDCAWEHQYGDPTAYAFDVPTITYSEADGGATSEATASSYNLTASDTAGASDASISMLVQPSKSVTVNGALRDVLGPVSESLTMWRSSTADPTPTSFSAGATWVDDVEQAGGYWVTSVLDGVTQDTAEGTSEWGRIAYYLDGDSLEDHGEERTAWRVLMHTQPFECMSILQALSYEVDDCSALTVATGNYPGAWSCDAGSTLTVSGGNIVFTPGASGATLTRTFTNPAGFSGYRYLNLIASGETNDQPISTVTIGAKEWDADAGGDPLLIDNASTTLTIDLCAPTNMTATIDTLSTRWGPDMAGGIEDAHAATTWTMPTDDDHVDGDGAMWGVQRVRYTVVWEFPSAAEGLDYTLTSLELGRKGSAAVSDLHVQPAFEKWILFSDYTDGGGTRTETYLMPYVMGNTDGRYSMEECAAEIVIVTPPVGDPTITYLQMTIADMLAKVNATSESWPITGVGTVTETALRNVGWTASYAGGVNVSDGADWSDLVNGDCNKNREAMWLCGGGGVYAVRGGTPGWEWIWDADRNESTAAVDMGQVLVDVFEWDPGLGDIYGLVTTTPSIEGEVTIAAKRVFRCRAVGIGLLEDCTPSTAATIYLSEGTTAEGNDGTDATGYYATGADYGTPGTGHTVTYTIGGTTYLTSAATLFSRWNLRRCFRHGVTFTDLNNGIAATRYNGIVCMASKGVPSGGLSDVIVHMLWGAEGPASTWYSSAVASCDQDSDLGLFVEANGSLVLSYSRAGTNYTKTNNALGVDSEWGAETSTTRSAMVLSDGRDQNSVFVSRTGTSADPGM